MTTGAPALGHWFMNHRGPGNSFHDLLSFLLVTVDTQGKFVFVKEEFGCFGAMRIVTTNAAFIFYDLVQVLGLEDQEFLVFVAPPA